MTPLDTVPTDDVLPATGAGSPGTLSELMVEVFLTRGAEHHGDVSEAADELRDLFASFGILTEENEAIIHGRAVRVSHRAERAVRRLLEEASLSSELAA